MGALWSRAGNNFIEPATSRLPDVFSTRVPQPPDTTTDNHRENRRRDHRHFSCDEGEPIRQTDRAKTIIVTGS